MAMIDLKKVANEALDAMTLWEHDMRYHDGRYRGGKCKFREAFDKPDRLDGDLDEANDYEGRVYSGRRFEREMIEREFSDEFHVDQKKGMRRMFLEPDRDGVNQLEVICREDTPDSFIDEAKARRFFKGKGYDFRGMSVETESGMGKKKGRKIFRIDVYRPEVFEVAKGGEKREVGEVIGVSEGDLTEEEKNRGLRKFGVKSEGGSFKRRTADDNRRDRVKKYMGMVGDWEGQSTREEAESGAWEKRRLASLKKAREDKARESAEEKRP